MDESRKIKFALHCRRTLAYLIMTDEQDNIDHCTHCGAPMDVSAFAPFSQVECPECSEHSRVKLKFGPYTLTRRHAIGGMSMVFIAYDDTLNREVAVKILNDTYSNDATRIRAFEKEAMITASLSHPNIVRLLRTGKAFGRFYIAMELVTGGHFEHHINERKRIPEAELLPLAIETAQGLKAAQSAGLIHRDIKPGNLLIDDQGHIKIVDFGLALVTMEGKAQATEFWATPFYVPPESVQGLPEDFRSDIYALGSTLYHALAGTPPCNEETMSTTLLLKAKQEVQPLSRVAPDISPRTAAIIDRAMAFDPRDRFSSYDEMIRLLQSARKHLGKEPVNSSNGLTKTKAILIAAATAAAVVAAILLYPQDSKTTAPPDSRTPDSEQALVTQPTNRAQQVAQPVDNKADTSETYLKGRNLLRDKNFKEAAELLASVSIDNQADNHTRAWSGVEATIAHFLAGSTEPAQQQAAMTIAIATPFADEPGGVGDDILLALSQTGKLQPAVPASGETRGARRVIADMISGLKNWQQGLLDPAAVCFRQAASAKLAASEQWAAIYQKFASDYLSDHHTFNHPIFSALPATPEGCREAMAELEQILPSLKTHGRSRFNIRAWQLDLARHAKQLESQTTEVVPQE